MLSPSNACGARRFQPVFGRRRFQPAPPMKSPRTADETPYLASSAFVKTRLVPQIQKTHRWPESEKKSAGSLNLREITNPEDGEYNKPLIKPKEWEQGSLSAWAQSLCGCWVMARRWAAKNGRIRTSIAIPLLESFATVRVVADQSFTTASMPPGARCFQPVFGRRCFQPAPPMKSQKTADKAKGMGAKECFRSSSVRTLL